MTVKTGFDAIMDYQAQRTVEKAAQAENKKLRDAKKQLAELEKDVPKQLKLGDDDEAKVRFLTDVPHVSYRVNAWSIGQGYQFFKTPEEGQAYIQANNIKNAYDKFIKPQPTISFPIVVEELKLGAEKRAWLIEAKTKNDKIPTPEEFVEKRVGVQHVIQFTGDDTITIMNKHSKKPLLSRAWFYHRQGSGTDTKYTLEDEDEKTPMPKAYKKIKAYDMETWVFPPDPDGVREKIQQAEAKAFLAKSSATESDEKNVSAKAAWA